MCYLKSMTDDRIPRINKCRCGREPVEEYGPTSMIACANCHEEIVVETAPFFRDPERQREHQAWRAADAWNERTASATLEAARQSQQLI